jgi:hypothetical protein
MNLKLILSLSLIVLKFLYSGPENIDVMRFGAKGDSKTDDTKAIQSAINYLAEKGGGTLYFPAGVYMVSNQKIPGKAIAIKLLSNVELIGDKKGNSILKLLPNQPNFTQILTSDKANNWKLKRLIVDGNVLAQQNPTMPNEHLHGLFIDQSSNIVVDSCKFINTGGDGVGIRGVIKPSSSIKISNSFFNGNRRNGLTLGSGFLGVNISNCYFGKEIKHSPIDTEPTSGTCGDVVIENNLIETDNLITLGGVSESNLGFNQVFRNNTVTQGSLFIIYGSNIRVEDNDITNSPKKAIITILRKNENVSISGNKLKVSGQSAINITYSANQYPNNIKIYNNQIAYNTPTKTCITISGADNVSIEKNKILALQPCKLLVKISATRSMNGLSFKNNEIGYFDQNFLISFIKDYTLNSFIVQRNVFENKKIINQNINYLTRLINSNVSNK